MRQKKAGLAHVPCDSYTQLAAELHFFLVSSAGLPWGHGNALHSNTIRDRAALKYTISA